MRVKVLVVGCILTLFVGSSSQAQVAIDVSKITCDQFIHGKVGEPKIIAAWLSGFYNGKRNNAVVDKLKVQANLESLEKFCYDEKNFTIPVMQAIERTISAK